MERIEEAASGAGTPNAAGIGALDGANSPIDFNMAFPAGQGALIWPLLGVGMANAISREVLAVVLGVTEREVRRLVSRERKAGLPIISSAEHAGYYRPASPGDIERFARSMRSRARETLAVADAARRALDAAVGQERIQEVLD